MKRYVFIGCIVATLVLIALIWWLAKPSNKICIVTCTEHAQCGGEVEGQRFCKGDTLYGTAQTNACRNAGTCESVCSTLYIEKFIEDCPDGCLDGACR